MAVEVVTQDTVLKRALELARGASQRIWLTSPWITQRAVALLLRDVLPRVQSEGLDVRIVYRIKEQGDLDITDLGALDALRDAGCQVRYSTRLHAKLVLIDQSAAIVSSSNLTATAGYSLDMASGRRNEELGVLLRDEVAPLAELEQQFLAIWDAGSSIGSETVGIAMDFPTVRSFSFVAIREVRQGSYVMARDSADRIVLGQVADITSYNRSFPRMNEAMWLTQGYAGGERRGAIEVPDLQSLFSHPSKDHGFLVTKTFFEPESVFSIARVEVIKQLDSGRLASPMTPAVPGSDVLRASPDLLRSLLGDGDVAIGQMLHHSEVAVALKGSEVLSKHLAVLGMTGSGKSNCVKLILRNFLARSENAMVRAVVIDTHGEYVPIAASIDARNAVIDVRQRRSVLDADVLKDLLGADRRDQALLARVRQIAGGLPEDAGLADLLETIDSGPVADAVDERVRKFAAAARTATDLCLRPEEGATILRADGAPEDMAAPGLYILDLRATDTLEDRAVKAAAVMEHVFKRSKETAGRFQSLVVIDEAQNYAPEQQTGWLTRARPSFDAAFRLASEGRKFGVGLVISTQRPARVNKDVLSQCNTHAIFRVANVEDLQAIAGSFEAASQPLLAELPGFQTGVCVVGGTAIGMVTRVEVPLFGTAESDGGENAC